LLNEGIRADQFIQLFFFRLLAHGRSWL